MSLQRTPLFETHAASGAKLVDFGGWEMPVQYSSIVDEHHVVRKAAGLFDISHMGEVFVSGPAAEEFLNGVLTNDLRKLVPGQGGAFVPAPLGAEELQREIDRLSRDVDLRTDELAMLESRFLEQRVRGRLMPTTLPVKEAFLGSPFGHRSDPILGLRAMHQGIDFNAESGTPVVAAADGMVRSAAYQSDFGNMIEIDHGDGLTTHYAHLSRMSVKPGSDCEQRQYWRIGRCMRHRINRLGGFLAVGLAQIALILIRLLTSALIHAGHGLNAATHVTRRHTRTRIGRHSQLHEQQAEQRVQRGDKAVFSG